MFLVLCFVIGGVFSFVYILRRNLGFVKPSWRTPPLFVLRVFVLLVVRFVLQIFVSVFGIMFCYWWCF